MRFDFQIYVIPLPIIKNFNSHLVDGVHQLILLLNLGSSVHVLNSVERQEAQFVGFEVWLEAAQGRTLICQIQV